jgi:hypothetical protein
MHPHVLPNSFYYLCSRTENANNYLLPLHKDNMLYKYNK